MVVLIADDEGIHPIKVAPFDRLLAWLRSSRLDEDLASGASPESTVTLAIHAQRLVRPAVCRDLAHSLERVVADADRPSRSKFRVPVCRDRILDSRAELQAVAGRLMASGPVSARGVARIRVLLSDGRGPLYERRNGEELRARLRAAFAELDVLTS